MYNNFTLETPAVHSTIPFYMHKSKNVFTNRSIIQEVWLIDLDFVQLIVLNLFKT